MKTPLSISPDLVPTVGQTDGVGEKATVRLHPRLTQRDDCNKVRITTSVPDLRPEVTLLSWGGEDRTRVLKTGTRTTLRFQPSSGSGSERLGSSIT